LQACCTGDDAPGGFHHHPHRRFTGRAGRGSIVWSGTFHSIGARILREYAERIGLNPGFTVHDREDSQIC